MFLKIHKTLNREKFHVQTMQFLGCYRPASRQSDTCSGGIDLLTTLTYCLVLEDEC